MTKFAHVTIKRATPLLELNLLCLLTALTGPRKNLSRVTFSSKLIAIKFEIRARYNHIQLLRLTSENVRKDKVGPISQEKKRLYYNLPKNKRQKLHFGLFNIVKTLCS